MPAKVKDDPGKIDPDDMGCGQRCFFTYGQMCQRAGELFNCCLTDYEEAMQKERRWEETVRLKERVLKQRDHLIRLEREQKQLMDKMTAFQTDTTQLIEETGENVRKELKKAFRMEVDISTKELMRKHERLSREQNGMSETIQEHEDKLGELGVRTDKIKRELNETFVQLQEVDEELKSHQESSAKQFAETNTRVSDETARVDEEFGVVKDEIKNTSMELEKESATNNEQNFDLVRIKKALEALRQEQLDAKNKESDKSIFGKIRGKGKDFMEGSEHEDSGAESEYSIDEDGNPKMTEIGLPKKRPKRTKRAGGIAGKMRMFVGKEPELSETDLPDVPEEDPVERPPHYEYMVHTPDEGETPSEFELRMATNENIAVEKTAEEKMEKRKLKKRAKRKKMAEADKTLKKKNTKVSATGGGGASLPAHVTNG
ncbi:coiled-coil domain-containing protein 171-like isoform X2 [Bolinopsis microptera]|uniref:coiled-coil domain-containing protein 171-like isoform X2 n=1 Tax=Bolinopsis microptera TaxID=2820187 RepID=UPI003079B4E2